MRTPLSQTTATIFSLKKLLSILSFLIASTCAVMAQIDENNDGFTVTENTFNPNRAVDSLNASHKKVPKGIKVWTIDEGFGDITEQAPDTAMNMFSNYVFTTGWYGEYNTTGNLGSPRINRIATDRDYMPRFTFTEPYGYFITKPSELRFTNTLSPRTQLYYNTCGNHTDGEDHIKALFASNINKRAGFGFKFDYDYGRGYYQNQSTALFNFTLWGSYLGERYQMHTIFSFDHMKNTENGGITNDEYMTHPEAQSETYDVNEIPTVLKNNWNRNDGFHATLAHRYNIGFYKKVPMTEQEKEAKRFAIKAQQEKEEEEQAAKKASSGQSKGTTTSGFIGRPDNAKVAGDLNDSTINAVKKQAQERAKQMADSMLVQKEKAPVDTSWLKDEYVPVTSFIHTLQFDKNSRTYIAYSTPKNMYANKYQVPLLRAPGDSLYDQVNHYSIRNRFAIGLHEGLNKYIPMGAKVFVGHEFRQFKLPAHGDYAYDTYNEQNFSIGGQIIKSTGNKLHYNATVETFLIGEDVGDLKIDGTGDINFHLWKDSISVRLRGFYHLTRPTFLQRHYHSKFFWWDEEGMNKQMHTHLEGIFSLERTRTSLRVAYDNIQNYVYLGLYYDRNANSTSQCLTNYSATIRQSSKNISLLTAELRQDFTYGILNWDNKLTFQQSSDKDILAVPTLNYWTNLYLAFKIAHVLKVHFGAEAFIFTKYNAPEYCPQLGQYAVQENDNERTKVGNHPYINVYANFHLKQCRFFVMMSHVNAGSGNLDCFTTPHQPMNQRILRLGLIWTFFN